MSEGWLAFGLAMMCERFLWPEDAFKSLAAGKVCHEKRSLDTIGPKIVALKACGFKYHEIDEMYHLAKKISNVSGLSVEKAEEVGGMKEPRCDRCNRKLKDPDSLSRGMGKTCYRKHQAYVEKFCISLFDADEKPKPQRQRKKREVAP